jgi:ubiquinone/menaquinone biosynthesis C-methylase UbiE
MDRVPEPELMLDAHQAQAYAAADFEAPHARFLDLLQQRLPELPANGNALDLGCGPGDITLRFARAFSGWRLDALDGSPAMLELGRRAALAAGLASRVRFHQVLLPAGSPPRQSYDLLLSNSLLHHLRQPSSLWCGLRRWAHPAARLFVMDLLRPASPARAQELVDRHAAGEAEILRSDFYASLLAAYRPAEVRQQLRESGLDHLAVEVVSDRHWIVWGAVHGKASPALPDET